MREYGKRKTAGSNSVAAIANHFKGLLKRGGILILLLISLSLMGLNAINPTAIKKFRSSINDVLSSAIVVMSQPVDAINGAAVSAGHVFTIYSENDRLRAENAKLLEWQAVAAEMKAENESLKQLLNFSPVKMHNYMSAKIVTDVSGALSKTAIVSAGASQGVVENQPVISHKGLVGRVIEVGSNTSKLLLITDINSKIPVISERTRERAILVGDNSNMPKARYLPEDSRLKIGERLLTTSDGVSLPSGIAVGVVDSIENGVVRITPFVDWHRLENISILTK